MLFAHREGGVESSIYQSNQLFARRKAEGVKYTRFIRYRFGEHYLKKKYKLKVIRKMAKTVFEIIYTYVSCYYSLD